MGLFRPRRRRTGHLHIYPLSIAKSTGPTIPFRSENMIAACRGLATDEFHTRVPGSSPNFGFRGIQNSLDYFDVLIHLTGLGQATIDATNQVACAVGVAQAEGRG